MSISTQNFLQNPVKKYIELRKGRFIYWNKAKEQNIEVPLPLEFVVCDELSTIKGWSDEHGAGIYANEVRDTHDIFYVKCKLDGKAKMLDQGNYQEIKSRVNGAKYAKSVYAIMQGELVNFCFAGAALSAWINKVSGINVKYTVSNFEKGKKGATEYSIPVFTASSATEEEISEAKSIDREVLQPYLQAKIGKKEESFASCEKVSQDQIAMAMPTKITPLHEIQEELEGRELLGDLPF